MITSGENFWAAFEIKFGLMGVVYYYFVRDLFFSTDESM